MIKLFFLVTSVTILYAVHTNISLSFEDMVVESLAPVTFIIYYTYSIFKAYEA